ncbi:MAG TPA: host attachment protein [Pseudomonadales bacterium]|nr:host attachment protein [Pseudomonadales bacterium]
MANDAKARVFVMSGLKGKLEEVATLLHPEARMRDRDLKSDAPGRERGTHGAGAHGLSEVGAARDHEADVFAAEVARFLDRQVIEDQIDHLVLCASPRMLGRLREVLPERVRDRVRTEIDKDLTGIADPLELREHLPRPLFTGVVLG